MDETSSAESWKIVLSYSKTIKFIQRVACKIKLSFLGIATDALASFRGQKGLQMFGLSINSIILPICEWNQLKSNLQGVQKMCPRLCGYCGGAVGSIISNFTQLHRSSFNVEFDTLYESSRRV